MEELDHTKKELLKKNEEIARLELELAKKDEQLNEIVTSKSWKITKPLRAANRAFRFNRQFKRSILTLFSCVFDSTDGGFFKRSRRALNLLITKGPFAFFEKINTVVIRKHCDSNDISSYQSWLIRYNCQEIIDAEEITKNREGMINPLISIILPTYNTEEMYLRACIESVIRQSYENWELCIADDASTDGNVKNLLQEYSLRDKRIKVEYREENGHISAASNTAIDLASGEWLVLLDHDDELNKNALLFVVDSLNKNPHTEFIYTDEDKIDSDGFRCDPHFKPNWNLDLLYSQNYVSHLGVYKSEIVRKISGFRIGYEGCQDFDLLLRYSREINQENIIHIPRVLYHWRIIEGSTAYDASEKPYTTSVGINVLQNHFRELKESVKVEKGKSDNTYKVNWLISSDPLVSIIIPTYNGFEITKQAIDSILNKTSYPNYEIILVDNNSTEINALNYFDEVCKHEKVTVLRYPLPFNYSAINNFAVKEAKGDIIGLVNNDIEVINAEWLNEMVSHVLRKDIGCVGAMLYYPNETIQHAGVICGLGGVAGHSHKHFPRHHPGYFRRLELVQNYSAVTAACLLVRKSVFNEVQGLNEKDLTVAFNDVDFCLKVQSAGYRNLWTPYAELYHHESISRGAEDNPEKIARFKQEIKYMQSTWNTRDVADFAYNPNLTKNFEDFRLS
ncbi:glycosyltransferase family 2 protein [Vibrio echinoideorum]|uniref:glycosyltransferase family 2 protein n=1 Tax=Vibrio echinoideorum TaxID=2100116 RepID=UPI00354ADB9F